MRSSETRFAVNPAWRPDGLAKPGEFHMRYVTRADLPRIREIGQRISGNS